MTGTGRIRETVCVLLRQPEQEGAMGKHLELTPRLRQIADASGGRIVIGGVPPRTDDDFPSKKIKL